MRRPCRSGRDRRRPDAPGPYLASRLRRRLDRRRHGGRRHRRQARHGHLALCLCPDRRQDHCGHRRRGRLARRSRDRRPDAAACCSGWGEDRRAAGRQDGRHHRVRLDLAAERRGAGRPAAAHQESQCRVLRYQGPRVPSTAEPEAWRPCRSQLS